MSSSLATNSGIRGALEGADAVRLQPVRGPDPLHGAQGESDRLGHRPAGPVGRFARRLGAGQRHHPAHAGLRDRRLARLAGLVAQQPVHAGLGVALLPAPDRRAADLRPPRHDRDVEPLRRVQDDPSAFDMLLRSIAIRHDRLEAAHDPPSPCFSAGVRHLF